MALGQGITGGTSTPSSTTEYLDALLSTSLAAYKKTLVDNIFKDSAFLTWLKMSGAWRSQNGGERIACPLMYGKNATAKSYRGFDQLDVTPQDGITTAFYEWKQLAVTITISGLEEMQNRGEGKLISLLEAKIKQAEMSIKEELSRQLIQGTLSGTTFVADTNEVFPLGYFLGKDATTDPASGGDIGNISNADESWWRWHTAPADTGTKGDNDFALNVSTYAGLITCLKRMYNYCSRGSSGTPDIVLMDQTSFEIYESAVDQRSRLLSTKLSDIGFDSVKLKGAQAIWDEVVPSIDEGALLADGNDGTAFFINTDSYNVFYDTQTDFIMSPFVEPDGYDYKTAKILWAGNSSVNNARKNGVVYGILHTITS